MITTKEMKDKKCRKRYSKIVKNLEINQIIYENAHDILHSTNFKQTKNYIQHGTMSVHRHCITVTKCSVWINRKFHLNCQERDLIRGALLHDYFLYDWHDNEHIQPWRLHGFFHPGIALKNAKEEYVLSAREKDVIKKHMWPLTIVPPRCRESWVVTIADKYCSIMETFHIRKGAKGVRNCK